MTDMVNEAETEVISAPSGAKKKLDPGFARNLKILGGALAILALVVFLAFFLNSGSTSNVATQSNVEVGGGNTQPAGQMTPAMESMLIEQQQIEAASAARAGKSYIPPDPTGRQEPVDASGAGQGAVDPLTQSTYESAAIGNGPAQLSERDTRRREGLERQLAQFLAGTASDGVDVRQRVSADRAASSSAGAAETSNVAPAQAASPATTRQVVSGLEIVAAELANDMTVPAGRSVFASASIRSGPLNGAFLTGSASVIDEQIAITFNQMKFGTTTYAVDAIVLDPVTASNAISGSVDRRLLQRYALPVAMAVAQGYFGAKATVGSVAVNVGSEAAVATPAPTSEQARSAGIAEGIKIAGQEVQKAVAAPIVVKTSRAVPVGIMFRAPVMEEIK